MKYFLIIPFLMIAACAPKPTKIIRQEITVFNGKSSEVYYRECEESNWCNLSELKNSRTIPMGSSTDYFCSPDSKFYIIKEQYKASQSFLVDGQSCSYKVSQTKVFK